MIGSLKVVHGLRALLSTSSLISTSVQRVNYICLPQPRPTISLHATSNVFMEFISEWGTNKACYMYYKYVIVI